MSDEIKASMELLTGDAAVNPLGMPDVYVDNGSGWKCPCGGLTVGPPSPGSVVLLVSWQCPGCGTIVAIRPAGIADTETPRADG